MFFLFCPSDFFFLFFWGDICVLRDSKFSTKKKRKKRKKSSAGVYTTRVQNFRVYISKTAWTFGSLWGKRAKIRHRLVITWFQCRFDFGRQIWLNIGPTQSVLRIFARNFVQTCPGAPGSGSFRKKNDKYFFLPTETPDYYLPF